MNILMVLDSEFPKNDYYDARVKKQIKSLIDAGDSVCLICKRGESQKEIENWNNAVICRFVTGRYSLLRFFSRLLMKFFFIDFDFLVAIRKALNKFKGTQSFSIIHVHDLPLVKTVLKCKRGNLKIILDMHENLPEALGVWNQWEKGAKHWLRKVFFNNIGRWHSYEAKMCKSVDHIIAVVDEMKTFLIEKHRLDPGVISVVSNTESEFFIKPDEFDNIDVNTFSDHFVLSYLGGLGPHRGLDTSIIGMKYIKHLKIKLLIVGSGSAAVEQYLKDLIIKENVSDNVIWIGWQPFDKAAKYVDISDVCLIPHRYNLHTANTVPHKLFQYMLQGKPLLVSSCPPLKRIVTEVGAGLVFEADNPLDFSRKVEVMSKDKNSLIEMSKNSISFSSGKYNWRVDSQNLINIYKKLNKVE